MGPKSQFIEEGSIQKTRQTVVVLDWGARSNAALGIFGVKVYSIVYIAVVQFSFTFVGVMFYVDLPFKFLIHIKLPPEVSRNSRKSQKTIHFKYC